MMLVGFCLEVSGEGALDSMALRSPQTQSWESGRLDLIAGRNKQPLWSESEGREPYATHLLPFEVPIPVEDTGERDVRLQAASTSHRGSLNQRTTTPSREAWRGYLSEKGPNPVIVVEVKQQQPATLPDSIWALIQGSSQAPASIPGVRAGSNISSEQKLAVSKEAGGASDETSTQNALDSQEPGTTPANRASEDGPDMSVDEVMDTHQRLMELFSTPAFATPARTSVDGDSMVTLRTSIDETRATVREGSRARFEIRR